MPGMDQFIEKFGGVSIATVLCYILAIVFIVKSYLLVKNYFEKSHDEDVAMKKQLAEAYESSQQSKERLGCIEEEMKELKRVQNEMLEGILSRERNRVRGELIKMYRHYTNPETNPSHSWTRMESDSFWDVFKDYENMNGDGYIHSHVQPAMEDLDIIEI